jgi:hypothetical protein
MAYSIDEYVADAIYPLAAKAGDPAARSARGRQLGREPIGGAKRNRSARLDGSML